MDYEYKEQRSKEYFLKFNHCKQSKKNADVNQFSQFSDRKDTNNFNFKKSNGYKYLWSCSGYGGKCKSCKASFHDKSNKPAK